MIVLSPQLGQESQQLIDRVQEVIRARGGQVDASHDWGARRLAYPIHKQTDGRFFLLEYQAEGDAVAEVERTLRITDGVLRYISVQQEHTGLPQPRPARDFGRREDVPLNEMRSYGAEPDSAASTEPAATDAPAETTEISETRGEE
jgi:small subunit ribosomal protein S6